MFEHTKGLKEVDMRYCEEITGKKCRGKFFADQSSQNFAGLFFPGDIEVLGNCPGLTNVKLNGCTNLTGKELSWKLLCRPVLREVCWIILSR